MFEKILELLTSKFTGIRKDAIEMLARNLALQCDNDDDVTAAIGKLTDEKVNEFVKGYRTIPKRNQQLEAGERKQVKASASK